MKKNLSLVIFTLFAFSFYTMEAQEMRFGVKGGVNFSNMTMKAGGFSAKNDGRTAFHIGVVAEFELSETFSIQPELLYNSVGSKSKDSFGGYTEESTAKLDYLSIPIMAKYYLMEGFAVEAGPQIGILMSAKEDYSFSGGGISESGSDDVKDALKGIDLGLGIGASYRLDMGLFFSARYVLGLSNIGKDNTPDFDDDDDWDWDDDFGVDFGGLTIKNNTFQISVGYMF